MSQIVQISTEYITLGALLKQEGIIDTGGAAKWFLAEHHVFVNGESENRRGRKLYEGDEIELSGIDRFVITR